MKRKPDPRCLFVMDILHSLEGSWSCNGNSGGDRPGGQGGLPEATGWPTLSFRLWAIWGRDSPWLDLNHFLCHKQKYFVYLEWLFYGGSDVPRVAGGRAPPLRGMRGFLEAGCKTTAVIMEENLHFLSLVKAGRSAPIYHLLIYHLFCTL